MKQNQSISIDFSALVDIISNVAGMMILLACVAIIVNYRSDNRIGIVKNTNKSISFPLAYVPEKRSLTICLKYDKIYMLPEQDLIESITQEIKKGDVIESLSLKKNGVNAAIELTPTFTGYRFKFKLQRNGGAKLNESHKTVEILDEIIKKFPPKRFFYVFHTWPECFTEFREVREYLLENGAEVGWVPRTDDPKTFDVIYSIGEYDENLTTIKAQ